ncbi:hypothetical protein [Fimbriiglobus ruber]|uniref:Uncharacterized protein n=1 Tax=Fimbriiglobus ruber TaxID=1908690 RepID=A0A225E1H4_9BACT|nr:hypothetical protein [Fimbriiglobus ruber]OWK42217.1 hypothetical protein FRUB_04295 [Fimbriiglobus ruber]
MTDTPENPTPAPLAASPGIEIDAANVVHDAERTSRHGLAHLEDEFLAEWHRMATYSETEAKALLAWLASKL